MRSDEKTLAEAKRVLEEQSSGSTACAACARATRRAPPATPAVAARSPWSHVVLEGVRCRLADGSAEAAPLPTRPQLQLSGLALAEGSASGEGRRPKGEGRHDKLSRLEAVWNEAVGKRIAKDTRLVQLKNRVLLVEALAEAARHARRGRVVTRRAARRGHGRMVEQRRPRSGAQAGRVAACMAAVATAECAGRVT